MDIWIHMANHQEIFRQILLYKWRVEISTCYLCKTFPIVYFWLKIASYCCKNTFGIFHFTRIAKLTLPHYQSENWLIWHSDWFCTKLNLIWCQIYRKSVTAIQIWFHNFAHWSTNAILIGPRISSTIWQPIALHEMQIRHVSLVFICGEIYFHYHR